MEKSACQIGIAPIKEDDLNRLRKDMEKRGIFQPKDTETIKRIKTLKLMVKMWMKRELALTEEEWTELSIIEIHNSNTEGEIVYITFSTRVTSIKSELNPVISHKDLQIHPD